MPNHTHECMNCGAPGDSGSLQQNLPGAVAVGAPADSEHYYRVFPLCLGCARCLRGLRFGTVFLGTEGRLTRYEITEGVVTTPPRVVTV